MSKGLEFKQSMFVRTTLFVFATIFLSAAIVGMTVVLLIRIGFIQPTPDRTGSLIILTMMTSAVVSSLLSAIAFRRSLQPIDAFLNGMKEIRKGNYTVRINENNINEKIGYLAENFNLMAQELGSIETLKSDFTDSFSHEFKTPIASIKGFAKLLKKPNLSDDERKEYLDIIISESERLSRLASTTLNVTKVESMEAVAEKKEYRLDEQIRQCVLLLEPRWSKKNLTVGAELDEVIYKGNEDLMRQVWINLIDNAVKFTPEGGEIAVSLSCVQNNAIATVSDNGCGMDEETQKRAFDKFFQGDRSRSVEGVGMGLSLVKKIVALSQGKINIKSGPGAGTSITVVLPLTGEQSDES